MVKICTISIHALLAESDITALTAIAAGAEFLSTLSLRRATTNRTRLSCGITISIHALLAESDYPDSAVEYELPKFLSTLSLRRATQIGKE